MRSLTQAFLHRPEEGVYGDCARTCIAMMLGIDRDEVPHLQRDVTGFEQAQHFRDWLAERGLGIVSFSFHKADMDWVRQAMKIWNPGHHCIVSGTSPRGTCHCVVLDADGVVHDPHPDKTGLVGPDPDDNMVIQIITPKPI